jgi:hypothetical protein
MFSSDTSNTDECQALATFLWHPYSATYRPQWRDFRLNDATVMDYSKGPLQVVSPPRCMQHMPRNFDILEIVKEWACMRGMRVRVINHLVVCEQSRDMMLVDFVLEHGQELVLLCTEYHPDASVQKQEMLHYMTLIRDACSSTMGMSVRTDVLSISGTDVPVVTSATSTFPETSCPSLAQTFRW